jgi:DNA polymerase-3 subunit beta
MFEVSTSIFLSALEQIKGVAPIKAIKPVLLGVRVHLKDNTLTLSGTDMENFIKIEMLVEKSDEKEEKDFLVNAKELYDIVKNLPGGDARFDFEGDNCRITAEANVVIPTMSAVDFPPDMETLQGVKVDLPKEEFIETCKKILPFTSNEEYQKQFTAVLMEFKETSVNFVGADGFRLAVGNIDTDLEGQNVSGRKILVSQKAMQKLAELAAITPENVVTLEVSEKTISVKTNNSVFKTRLYDMNFPDYQQIIPLVSTSTISFTPSEFLKKYKVVELFAKGGSNSVLLEVERNTLRVSAKDTLSRSGEASIEIPIAQQGEAFKAAFNPKYLTESLKLFKKDEPIVIKFAGANKAVTIQQDDNYYQIIMPLKLRD